MTTTKPDLITVSARCHHCGAPYTREIEAEYARLVREHGICDGCYDVLETVRDMIDTRARCEEIGDGLA